MVYNTSSWRTLTTQPVGFIGLGNMGAPMARNLLAGGHQLLLYDISEARLGEVEGGERASSPAEVAARSSTIITMLPSGQNVLECYSGEEGILRCVCVCVCVCVCGHARACARAGEGVEKLLPTQSPQCGAAR